MHYTAWHRVVTIRSIIINFLTGNNNLYMYYTMYYYYKIWSRVTIYYTTMQPVIGGIPSPGGIPLWGYRLFFPPRSRFPPSAAENDILGTKNNEGNLALSLYFRKSCLHVVFRTCLFFLPAQ